MTEEKELKKEGEELAKLAVESGLGRVQLRAIYRRVRTKPIAFAQAFIQNQISRGGPGLAAFVRTLELSQKFDADKAFEKVLMYAIMLYVYVEVAPTMNLRMACEGVVKDVVNRQGFVFEDLELRSAGKRIDMQVRTRHFHGNPKALAMEIEKALKSRVSELSDAFLRIWIE